MFIETNEARVAAIPAIYVCGGFAVGVLVALTTDIPMVASILPAVLASALAGTTHAVRLLRRELECAYIELARATMMVTGARLDSMSLQKFEAEMYRCLSNQLARFSFSLITLREGSRPDAKVQ